MNGSNSWRMLINSSKNLYLDIKIKKDILKNFDNQNYYLTYPNIILIVIYRVTRNKSRSNTQLVIDINTKS